MHCTLPKLFPPPPCLFAPVPPLRPNILASFGQNRSRLRPPLIRDERQRHADVIPCWHHTSDLGQGVTSRGHKTTTPAILEGELVMLRSPSGMGRFGEAPDPGQPSLNPSWGWKVQESVSRPWHTVRLPPAPRPTLQRRTPPGPQGVGQQNACETLAPAPPPA